MPEAMEMSVMLSPETVWKSMTHAPVDCKGQGSSFCSGVDDCRFTAERDLEGFSDNPSPAPSSLK